MIADDVYQHSRGALHRCKCGSPPSSISLSREFATAQAGAVRRPAGRYRVEPRTLAIVHTISRYIIDAVTGINRSTSHLVRVDQKGCHTLLMELVVKRLYEETRLGRVTAAVRRITAVAARLPALARARRAGRTAWSWVAREENRVCPFGGQGRTTRPSRYTMARTANELQDHSIPGYAYHYVETC
jgi:hypothetical protein